MINESGAPDIEGYTLAQVQDARRSLLTGRPLKRPRNYFKIIRDYINLTGVGFFNIKVREGKNTEVFVYVKNSV